MGAMVSSPRLQAVIMATVAFAISMASPLPWIYSRWPKWAVNPVVYSVMVCGLVFWAQSHMKKKGSDEKSAKKSKKETARDAEFRAFQWQWLAVYMLTMLADWLQGTHMYTLYSSYEQPVGTLYAVGFTSSAVFGTFLGLYVDKYGRRLGCITFCVLELIINSLEHVNNFHLLILGRILGGLSTSLLFTAFESWMVSEHRKRGFPEEDIAGTFALAQMANGAMAVLAGLLAQISADIMGDIGPFQLAIALTALCLVLVCFWEENYGGDDSSGPTDGENLFKDAMRVVMTEPRVLLLGLIQSLFEGAMYTFVIVWVPTLAGMVPGGKPGEKDYAAFAPGQGWIFTAMMVCISIGAEVFAGMLKVMEVEQGCVGIFGVAALSMLVPIVSSDFNVVLSAFLVLEACIGASFGAMATMRSQMLPDALQASIMNIFRVPLNILVVFGARLGDILAPAHVFAVTVSWFALAAVLQVLLARLSMQRKAKMA